MAANGKVYPLGEEALEGLTNGSSVMVSGYLDQHLPEVLLSMLVSVGPTDLTVICQDGLPSLSAAGLVRKFVCSHPRDPIESLEVEPTPAGVLAERIRAGGAGLGGVFLPTALGTPYAEGLEVREINGRPHALYPPLKADFALLRADVADTLGNLVYSGTQRNWNPIMAMAASTVVVEVNKIVAPGQLDPELVVTPGIFIDRIVERKR